MGAGGFCSSCSHEVFSNPKLKLMIKKWERLHGLFASGRIANLPSVASNVFLGMVVAVVRANQLADKFFWFSGIILIVSAICIYLAGNFLNDWSDRDWDAIHRPERALPMGWFSVNFYAGLAVVLGCVGLGLSAWISPICVMISVMILCFVGIYTYWHKRSAWSVIAMGMCRGLLPVLGYCAIHDGFGYVWPIAVGLFSYIVGLSLSARNEMIENASSGLKNAVGVLFCVPVIMLGWNADLLHLSGLLGLVGVFSYCVWIILCVTVLGANVSSRVSNLLAGIPFVDGIVLLPLALGMMWTGSADIYLMMACLLVPPLAVLCCKMLQWVSPAS
jgi:4-hydroxybenzoate polyprenyltransferase